MDEIYRFRRLENLLGKHEELARQEIYFATPEQLNDPMEGYRDIFWQGDEIIWENFLINYLRCVSRIFFLYLLVGESKKLDQDDFPLQPYGLTNETPQSEAIFERLKTAFFKHTFIKNLPSVLAERTSPIRRQELSSYLSFVQQYAINTVSDIYHKEGMCQQRLFYHDVIAVDKVVSRSHLLARLVNRLEKKLIGVSNAADLLFSVADRVRKQHELAVKYNEMTTEQLNSNGHFLLVDLPERFLDKLETLMYSKWYSASFLGNCTNSAIWGHYAENHQGVCLIFAPDKDGDKPKLDLTTVYGVNNAGQMKGLRPHFFQKIEYHHRHVAIDFFKSLGRSPLYALDRLWYKNSRGDRSICAIQVDSDEWRTQYWENFAKTYTVKLEEWAYEEEYRLVINDMLHDYSQASERKLMYDFRQLKGIIFGMKTPLADKQRIIKIIREKCVTHNSFEFTFYQAYYDQGTGKISRYKLDILSAPSEEFK